MMNKPENQTEFQDIRNLLAPLRQSVPVKKSDENLANLLEFAQVLGPPPMTIWGTLTNFVRRILASFSLWQVFTMGLLIVLVTASATPSGSVQPMAANRLPTLLVEQPEDSAFPESTAGSYLAATVTPTESASTEIAINTLGETVAPKFTATATLPPTSTATAAATGVSTSIAQATPSTTAMVTATKTPAETPTPAPTDTDGDGIEDSLDNCPTTPNPTQTDIDNDGMGDACDPTPNGDRDADGIDNLADNCPDTFNPDQVDSNGNGIGDACETAPTASLVPSVIVINIHTPLAGERVTGVGKTKFGAVVFDEAYGNSDGAGIDRVTFVLSGPQGVFHESLDAAAPYCEFEGAAQCDSMGNPLWSTLFAGDYRLTVTAYSVSGATLVKVVDFIIDVQ